MNQSTFPDESEENYKTLPQSNFCMELLLPIINSISDPIFVKDREHRWVFMNDAFCNFLSYNREQLLGKSDYDFFPKEEADIFWEKDESVFTTGSSNENEEYFTDGNSVTRVISTKKILLEDSLGNKYIIGIIRDNTKNAKKYQRAKIALQQTEERFQKFAANVPGMLYQYKLHVDGSTSFTYVSSGCYEIFGFTPEQIQADNKLIESTINPHDIESFYQAITISRQTLQPFRWEGKYILPSGEFKYLKAESRPDKQPDGSIIWDGIITDITRLKKAEKSLQQAYGEMEIIVLERTKKLALINAELQTKIAELEETQIALRESESKLQKLAENLPGMVYTFKLRPDGSMYFPYVSSGCYEIYQLTPEEIKTDLNLVTSRAHHDDCESFFKSVALSAQTMEPWEWEGRIVLPSGLIKWVKGQSRPEKQADGSILWYGVLLDVTVRKQAEFALQESESQYRNLVETSQDVIWSTDIKGNFTFINQAATKMYGYELEEIIGRHFTDFLPPEQHEKDLEIFRDLKSGESKFQYETISLSKDGRLFNVLVNAISLKDKQGNVIGITGINSNITARKQVEARLRKQTQELQQALDQLQRTQIQLVQSEKMSSLGQLVAGIAHEINNPTSFIYGNLCYADEYIQDILALLQLYQQNYPQPELKIQKFANKIEIDFLMEDLPKLMDSMKNGAERIRCIVLSLRNFSRLDEAEMKAVDIHEGLDSTLMILQNRFKANGSRPEITIIKEYAKLPLVECYAGQLNQVFMNIFTNAVDALEESFINRRLSFVDKTSNSNPQIHICTELTQENTVVISIYDNGYGIPENTIKRLFDPFFTTKPVGKGTGMGLSVSYQIITEKHHGSLQCFSQLGKGAKFVIAIPLVQIKS